jgi:acyl dehydratase
MNHLPNIEDLQVGDALPGFVAPPLSRLTLALYCGASGDHNPIHVDSDFAKAAGMRDVFAHGMLSMAWLAHVLTHWVPQTAIRSYGVRFSAITQVGEVISCTGKIVEKLQRNGEECVRVALTTSNENGQVKLTGEALIALAPLPR